MCVNPARILSWVFLFALLNAQFCFAGTLAASAEPPAGANVESISGQSNGAAANNANTLLLPAGTRFTAVLLEDIYSQRNRPGDEVTLAVKDDVYLDGTLVIPKGAQVIGKVTRAMPAKGWG